MMRIPPSRLHGRDCLILSTLTIILSATSSSATTWHVEQDGSGDFTSIQNAVNSCASGDTVLVGPGRYAEHAPYDYGAITADTYVVLDTPDITLRGTDRDAVIVGPPTFTKLNAIEPQGIVPSQQAGGLRVENLTVENVVDGIRFESAADATDCVVRNCEDGVEIISGSDHTLTRCAVYDSPGLSVRCELQHSRLVLDQCHFEGGGVQISSARDVLVTECVFAGGAFLRFQMSTDGTIRDSTFDSGSINVVNSSADLDHNVIGPSANSNLQFSGTSLTATHNIFRGGNDATLFLSGTSVVMHDNHILNGGGYTVTIDGYDSPNYTLDLRNNWWGTADSTQIATWIRDVHDDPTYYAEVKFVPFAGQPLPARATSFGQLKAGFRKK